MITLLVPAALAGSWPDLAAPAPAEGLGAADAALVIGIEDYFAMADVPGAADNATAWYDWLTRTRGVPLDRVRVLRNAEAVREAVVEHAAETARRVQPEGTLWVVFVGHGAPMIDGSDGLLVGADAQANPKSLVARSVRRTELLAAVEGGAQADTVVVLDACFSGRDPSGAPLVPGLQPAIPTWALAPPAQATVLSAAHADEVAGPLPGTTRPAFSYLVLGALRGWGDADGDGAVTAAEALQYSRATLSAVLTGRAQTPELTGPASTAALSRGTEAGPDVQALVREGFAPAAAPAPAVSEGPDPRRAMLDRILRMRNTENGRRLMEEDAGTLYPGVGFRGIVVGRTTLPEVLENRAINTFSSCFLEGRDLPKRKGETLWPCHELADRHRSKARSLIMPDFHAYTGPDGGPVAFVEVPPFDHSAPIEPSGRDIATPEGVRVGSTRAEVEAVLGPPDVDHSGGLEWTDLGLELVMSQGAVRVMRVRAADGIAAR